MKDIKIRDHVLPTYLLSLIEQKRWKGKIVSKVITELCGLSNIRDFEIIASVELMETAMANQIEIAKRGDGHLYGLSLDDSNKELKNAEIINKIVSSI